MTARDKVARAEARAGRRYVAWLADPANDNTARGLVCYRRWRRAERVWWLRCNQAGVTS